MSVSTLQTVLRAGAPRPRRRVPTGRLNVETSQRSQSQLPTAMPPPSASNNHKNPRKGACACPCHFYLLRCPGCGFEVEASFLVYAMGVDTCGATDGRAQPHSLVSSRLVSFALVRSAHFNSPNDPGRPSLRSRFSSWGEHDCDKRKQ